MKIVKITLIIILITSMHLNASIELRFNPRFVEKLQESREEFKYKIKATVNIDGRLVNLFIPITWNNDDDDLDFRSLLFKRRGKQEDYIPNFRIWAFWEGWGEKFQNFNKVPSKYFIYLDIGEKNHVVILKGSSVMSTDLLTIVHLPENDIPKVIFNTEAKLVEIVKNQDGSSKLRVRFGIYTYDVLTEETYARDEDRPTPCNPDEVYVCDIYVKNNELVVKRLPWTAKQVFDTFTKEDLEKSYR